MSRWVLSLDGQKMSNVDKWNAFARLNTGAGRSLDSEGLLDVRSAVTSIDSLAKRHAEPLIAFRDDNIYSSLNGSTDVFRRDFDLDKGEKFDSKWITGWKPPRRPGKMGNLIEPIASRKERNGRPILLPTQTRKRSNPNPGLNFTTESTPWPCRVMASSSLCIRTGGSRCFQRQMVMLSATLKSRLLPGMGSRSLKTASTSRHKTANSCVSARNKQLQSNIAPCTSIPCMTARQ